MKKFFLFSFLAVFLAGLGFGGISMAQEACTDGQVNNEGGACAVEITTCNNGKAYYSSLSTAISAVQNCDAGVETVKLLADINETPTISDKKIVLDLGGNKLTINSDYGLDVYNSTLTVSNGTIYNADGVAVYLNYGNFFTLDTNAKIIGKVGMTIDLYGGDNTNTAIINGEIDATDGIVITKNASKANLTVNGTIKGENVGVTINGILTSNENCPTITIGKDAMITTDGNETVALYLAGYGKTTIADGAKMSGTASAIEIRAGELTVNGGNFKSTANNFSITPNGGGSTTVGAALAIAQHTTKQKIDVTINGGIFEGPVAVNQANPQNNGQEDSAKVTTTIKDGTFNGSVANTEANSKLDIQGGTFSDIPTVGYTVPEGKMLALNNENRYELVNAVTVTLVNGNETQGTITMPKNGTLTQEGIGSTLTAEGKVFMGWYYANGTKFPDTETPINENITLNAKWGHTVKFLKESEDTSAIKELIVEENTIIKYEDIPEDPTKEGYKFKEWTVGKVSANVSTYNIDIDVTFVASWTELISASTSSIKAASVPNDEGREKRNLDKFTVSNSYDATSKTLTVTITDNGMEAYTGGNSENAKKWLGLIADFGVIVKGSNATGGIEKYTIGSDNGAEKNIDRDDANIYGGDEDSSTDFIIWINREDKDGKTIRFVNAAAEDDYVNVKFVFKDKQSSSSSSSSSGGGGGGGGSSSSSCKNLPSNAVANNSKKPSSSTNYFYDTDTSKVCSFVCKEGYEWNKSSSKCEVAKTTTTGDKTDETKVDETKVDESTNENTGTDIGGTPSNEFSKEFNDAYTWAFKNGITTMDSIEKADMNAPLTRIAMAKMLSQYAINVLGKTPDTTKVVPTFPDVDEQLNKDYNDGVTLAYQLGIMGINIDTFRPFDLVTRAEFGTALSRMLFGLSDGEEDLWYKPHLDKLMNEKIITIDTPDLQELRGYVMIMLMRSAQ